MSRPRFDTETRLSLQLQEVGAVPSHSLTDPVEDNAGLATTVEYRPRISITKFPDPQLVQGDDVSWAARDG